jgi:uncharacterized protein (TIGR02246 family)
MNEPDLARIERLLSDFAWHADRGDGASLAELFLPDAVLIVGGRRLEGRAEIAADCRRRALTPGRKTRHVWSNLRLDLETDGTLSATALQLTFEQTDSAATKVRVNDLTDRYRRDAGGTWRFVIRIIERQMALEL